VREGTRNFLVGASTIAALAGLVGLLMRFGELDPLFHPRYTLTIQTTNAAGLRVGSPVDHNGVPVGTITEITTVSDPKFPVRLVAMIDEDTYLPDDSQPKATASLLGGSARLELNRPAGASPNVVTFFPTDGTATIRGGLAGGLVDTLNEQLDKRMAPLTEALDSFNKLSATYIQLGENLNALVNPTGSPGTMPGANPTPGPGMPVTGTMPATYPDTSLHSAIARMNAALADIQASAALAREFLSDESMRADVRESIRKAHELIEKASEAANRYTKLADSLERNSDQLVRAILPVADEMGSTLEDIRRLTRLASDGEGTVANLLKNPDLYNSLTDAAIRLERALVDFQLLIQKLKAEGVKIGL